MTARLPLHAWKEIRALAPVWLIGMGLMAVSALLAGGRIRGLGIFAYVVAAVALGALSIGQEYGHRTLGWMLSQPIRRERLLMTKLSVLTLMLLTLAAFANAVVFADDFIRAGRTEAAALFWLPLFCGLFVAPWLTMVCRSLIAGVVFSMAMPGVVLTVGQIGWVAAYGQTPETDVMMAILWRGTLAVCAIGAAMTWRMFQRLEVVDTGAFASWPAPTLPAPSAAGAAAATARHPFWQLANKELRLQQMALAVAVLYVLGWLVATGLGRRIPDDMIGVLSVFYGAFIPALIGSLASAEERQLGTLDWQTLLPMAAWKQWSVKVAAAGSLALVLSLGLPALLLDLPVDALLSLAPPVLALTFGSLYVSSLSTNGLWAFLISVPVALGVAGLVVSHRMIVMGNPRPPGAFSMSTLALALAGAFLLAVLGLALENHRSAERGAGRIWKQVLALSGCLAFAVATWLMAVRFA